MIIAITVGIILAVFILGLLEEISQRTWYWIGGGVIVWLIYAFWHDFWPDIGAFVLGLLGMCILLYLVRLLASWLEKTFGKHKK